MHVTHATKRNTHKTTIKRTMKLELPENVPYCALHCSNCTATIALIQLNCYNWTATIGLKQLHWNNCTASCCWRLKRKDDLMLLLLLPILLIICYFGPQMNITGHSKQKETLYIHFMFGRSVIKSIAAPKTGAASKTVTKEIMQRNLTNIADSNFEPRGAYRCNIICHLPKCNAMQSHA